MLRQKWGSVVCPSCRNLVGVNDERCFTCGRWNPGLWGFAPLLSRLGRDLGFTQFVMWSCIILYLLTLAFDVQGVSTGGFNFLAPSGRSGSSVVGDQAKSWAVAVFVFGFILRGVGNWAHLGGFAGGYAAAKFLDPLEPERVDHLVDALACLALTAIAIMFSIVNALGSFRI